MNSHLLVKTKNVQRGLECLSYILSRPVAHQVGMGMIYGKPGLGKTQFSMRYAIEHDCVYFSALKASTPKSFTVELLHKLRERYEPSRTDPIIGPKARLFRDILDTINLNTSKNHMPVIIIDEVDNIIHYPHEEIIGMLRDIADNTVATVVMVGMQDLREKVMKLNSHYYNRFIYFAEFKPLTDNDVLMMCAELSTIAISPDLARYTNEKPQARGDARKVVKAIRLYEEIALKLSQPSLDLNTYLKVVGK
ncbi:MAG: ATP-binding protein [Candidatus Cloacimonetes bacterium]|nr:ATP-binding protein [Candidatus Cloacimonadota bacterium]